MEATYPLPFPDRPLLRTSAPGAVAPEMGGVEALIEAGKRLEKEL
jgi:hypothetical protein